VAAVALLSSLCLTAATVVLHGSVLVSGLLASASEDGVVRLWDVDGASPSLVGSKNLGVVRATRCFVILLAAAL
jgi:hypothetical protein